MGDLLGMAARYSSDNNKTKILIDFRVIFFISSRVAGCVLKSKPFIISQMSSDLVLFS